MFSELRLLSQEQVETVASTQPCAASSPSTPSQPPMRFGATRIILPPDPDRSVISIVECPNDLNVNDYMVFISSHIRGESTYYAELLTLLRTLTPDSNVNIYIGSPGGSLHTGAMIANAIATSKARVTTIAIGIVASAAALIWSYGHNRVVRDGAVLMFHMSSHMDMGNSRAIQIQAENTVRYVKEIAIDPLVEQGILTPEEAETIIDRRRDLWLDSVTLSVRLEKLHGKAA